MKAKPHPATYDWTWWFELCPERFSPPGADTTPAVQSLASLLGAPAHREAELASLAEGLEAAGDREGACAALGGGLAALCEGGRRFAALPDWIVRADAFLAAERPLAPLARASLLLHTVVAGLAGPADLPALGKRLERLDRAVEDADSDPLRIMFAAATAYLGAYIGTLHRAREAVADALYLCPDPMLATLPKAYLHTGLALVCTLQGDALAASEHLDRLASRPEFDRLPPFLWMLCQSHRLFAQALLGKGAALDSLAESIRARAIPEHNNHLHGYLHYSLGVAALLDGKAAQALDHGRRSYELGERCGSVAAVAVPALLVAQALADTGEATEALAHLDAWLPRWEEGRFALLAAAGGLEKARLLARQGRLAAARAALAGAHRGLPQDEPLPAYHRSPEFVERLVREILPPPPATSFGTVDVPLHVTTLGGLEVNLRGRSIFDREWRGDRSKTLLKALVVLGGQKISDDSLCDLLWPDADGLQARQNLKVAAWRLRRLGCAADEPPLPWLVVRQGQWSLVRALCAVDCHEFERHLQEAQEAGASLERLAAALDLYRGDFLSGDDSASWVVSHRERLRHRFLTATHTLARRALALDRGETAQVYLERAAELDPTDEHTAELLIRILLAQGYPGEALRRFRLLEQALTAVLGIAPGHALTDLIAPLRTPAR